MADNTLRMRIITPEGTAFEGQTRYAVFPAVDGQLAVYPMHAPLVAALGNGEIRYYPPSGEARYRIGGGFLEVNKNEITVSAEPASEPPSGK